MLILSFSDIGRHILPATTKKIELIVNLKTFFYYKWLIIIHHPSSTFLLFFKFNSPMSLKSDFFKLNNWHLKISNENSSLIRLKLYFRLESYIATSVPLFIDGTKNGGFWKWIPFFTEDKMDSFIKVFLFEFSFPVPFFTDGTRKGFF